MITAVDTNVLLDVLVPGATDQSASLQALERARTGGLVVGEAVYAEIAAGFEDRAAVDLFLADTGIRFVRSSTDVLHTAGLAWSRYTRRRPGRLECPRCGTSHALTCRQCGQPITPRQHIITDFLIGAHALASADQLLTRDRGYYATYYPTLRLA